MARTLLRRFWNSAARIVFIYAVFAALWIFLSDTILGLIVRDPAVMTRIAVSKGLTFVIATSILLFVLIRGHLRETRDIRTSLTASEENLSSYIASAPIGVFVFQSDGTFVDMNPAAEIMVRGRLGSRDVPRITDLMPPQYHARVREALAELMRTGHWEMDMNLGGQGDTPGWVRLHGVRLTDSRCVMFCQDITDGRRAGLEIRQSEARYRSLFGHMLEGFTYCRMLYDEAGEPVDFLYLDVNEAFSRLTGLHDVIGKRVSDVIPGFPTDNAALIRQYAGVAAGGPPLRVEVYAPGLRGWFDIGAYSMERGYFIAVFDNITERKRAQQVQDATVELLRICNGASNLRGLFQELTKFFRAFTGCDAVGVRLQENGDYPYFETTGFDEEFVCQEHSLCSSPDGQIARDGDGRPHLECMCGNVIAGRIDTSLPIFTPHGSFWTPSATALVAATPAEDLPVDARNRCTGRGYESIALIPLRTGDTTLGLVQFNDRRMGMFTRESVSTLESLLSSVAIALDKLRAEEALLEESTFSQQVIEGVNEGIVVHDTEYRIRSWNPFMERMTGMPRAEVIGRRGDEVLPFLREAGVMIQVGNALRGEPTQTVDYRFDLQPRGRAGWAGDIQAPLRNAKGDIIGAIGTVREITARVQAAAELAETSEKLLQAEKMEAVGRLAGGVAHDFNNILTAMYGYTDILLSRMDENDPERSYVGEIRKAAVRAASLTQQLLSFSRRQTLQPRVVDINGLVKNLERMLARLIGEDIELTAQLAEPMGMVLVDPARLEQALLNLAVNARDAMPHGGSLTITTADVVLGEDFAATHLDASPGPHVRITVSDTGEGMDDDVQSHLFEPFFTTKDVGKGTGLGLSSVYGIIKQSGGCLTVTSAPGQGTTFSLYLPRVDGAAKNAPATREAPAPRARGGETILFVEDDPAIRDLMTLVLSTAGYRVITATNGAEALANAGGMIGSIDLMITDIVMPRMNGRELAERMRTLRPDLKVVYMSGHTNDSEVLRDLVRTGSELIEKPVLPEALLARVYAIIHGGAA